VVTPAPNLQNFILQKQVLASGDVASGCRVKRVAPMTVTRIFFEEKCTSKRGLAVFIQKLRRYHLVDLAVKHDYEMVSVTYKFMPDRVLLLEIAINSHELLK
jgi:hypothetical protein